MSELMHAAAEHFGWTLAGLVVIVALVVRTIVSIISIAARERTRREIAAYVAEGSMKPEDADRILRAEITGDPRGGGCG